MIELKDVSTERLITFFKHQYTLDRNNEDAKLYLFLHNSGVRNFQELKNLIDSGKIELCSDFLKESILSVEENILFANNLGCEMQIFKCNDYKDSDVSRKILKTTDRKNSCGVLLYKNPVVNNKKLDSLKKINISTVKDLLGKVVAHTKSDTGKNAFLASMHDFNASDAERLRDSINFYEEQVLRQSEENTKKDSNLFILNKREKEIIVSYELKNIIKYIVQNADVCVWGDLTTSQKNKLMDCVTNYNFYNNKFLRQRMIEIIASYTTLTELKSDVVKQKTLDRFIIR